MAGVLSYPKMLFRMLFTKQTETVLNFPEVGWNITIPKSFHLNNSIRVQHIGQGQANKVKALYGNTSDDMKIVNQFTAIHELQNVFGAIIVNLQQCSEYDWDKCVDKMDNDTLDALRAQYKEFANVELNTETDKRQKGNVVFKTFEITAASKYKEVRCYRHYSTVRNNHGIFILMSFAVPEIGEKMLNALRASTFS